MSAPASPRDGRAASAPYPWPFDGLRPDALALVLAGWDGHWAGRATDPDGAAARRRRLAEAVVGVGGVVVRLVHDLPPRSPAGAAAPEPLGAVPGTTLTAGGIDGFHGGPLDGWLRRRGRTQVLVAGHALEGPVHSTLRSANDRGLECCLVTDACSALEPSLIGSATSQVCMSGGIFGAVADTAAVIDLLAGVTPPPADGARAGAPTTPTEEVPT